MERLERVSQFVGKTFAIWVILFACLAFYLPDSFKWLGAYITPLLGIIMFGMGLTVSPTDFKEVFRRPKDVAIGVIGQFIIMPLLAFVLAKGLQLPPEIAVGVILVGCCPGGTSSNVMTYLAKGDVPLSVTVTSITTLLAPIVTPGLILLFASQWVPINATSLLWSILQIVIIPILLGFIFKTFLRKPAEVGVKALPLISTIAIVAIVAAVVAGSQQKIAETGLIIFAVVILHNGLGLLLGYLFGKMLGLDMASRKAVSIEVGMQNSGLGAAIASAHFSPLSAVPSAIFSVWHNISGPIVATIYSRMKNKPK
ncbi:bile acid:sodium symporter family protein [Paenibacillus apiarius]|uniref:Bile acid:sodium symporter family protein n=1 Tax=Paenibacillus apiarius TaxID=46240 RepID=A0ABT4DR77_9BACL|nr:bile acid:sodium symporter family protein [Paenibacillus apiarius]MCY9514546.1 bile acid:sodium symporter family protein [Paenibacillus apiarius]MCY9518536.1 bile acid:sodium symporter family protein [Paenibacillus apiarius]MCY9552624.1 bile acid:sodium symporter family protein [Paenibacillus apiarius]MCY9557048.1 bile acid:sodium symporter family protein [Paenibacillus apiarius]MCY9685999.1 bile acid:sodium symporter family protein [Paenibacillus apiarius]